MKKYVVLGGLILLGVLELCAQNIINSYVLQIEGNKIYLDVTAPKVKVGDVLSIYSEAGYMIHPVTKQKIKKEGEILADLEIIEVKKEYSIASIYPENAISKIKAGMVVSMPEILEEVLDEIVDENIDTYKSNSKPVFNTPSDVIEWHDECTGANKLKNTDSYACLIEKVITLQNKKGKIQSTIHSVAIAHALSQKGYVKTDTKLNILGPGDLEMTFIYVVNGSKGWEKTNKGKTKEMKEERLMQIKETLQGSFEPYFNNRYNKQLLGNRFIENKECVGLYFEDMKGGNVIKNFYDLESGLLVASYVTLKGEDEVMAKVKEYQDFNGIMMPSVIETLGKKGRLITEKIIRFIPNYPLDNISFTEEDINRSF